MSEAGAAAATAGGTAAWPARTLLALNAGSSSIKYALFDAAQDGRALAAGSVEGLGTGQATAGAPATHAEALASVLSPWVGKTQVVAVGHRIVHGGVAFEGAVRIDETALAGIRALQALAPLHQPHNLAGVRAAMEAFPEATQVACFDTAFHRSAPELNQRFALPQEWFEAGVRRYGFHGLSYESIVGQLKVLEPGLSAGKWVVAHLGNGSSLCAVHGGRSVATTMSFSPLDGLPMGTRCGRLDPAVVLHLIQHHGLSPEEVSRLLVRESGLLGLSGISSDVRTLQQSPVPAARMALAYLVEHLMREIAGMAAALRGLDGIVFTGGIGENAAKVRALVLKGLAWLGVEVDEAANAQGLAGSGVISTSASAVRVRVIKTNEEAVIAGHTRALCAH